MQANQGPDHTRAILAAVLFVLSLLLLLRVYPPVAFMAFAIGTTVGFFLLGGKLTGWLGTKVKDRGAAAGASSDEFQQRVSARMTACRQREERFRDEGEAIMRSIATLRDDLARNPAADARERERAEATIRELEAEFSLRHAKASFFADCAERLAELLNRHRLVESIAARRRELRTLRSTNHDDEAAAEETRYHLERDAVELDTIVELTNRAAHPTAGTEQAEHLRHRLEQLREKLRKKTPRPEKN